MSYPTISLSFVLAIWVCAFVRSEQLSRAHAEVEIVRGEHLSELNVYVVNPGPGDFQFPTGARGRGGDVPEGEMAGSSTGLTAIPRVTFEWNPRDGRKPPASLIEIHAPIFRSNWQSRAAPEPEIFVVPSGKRRLYYSFKVPAEYVKGEFKGGYLPRREISEKGAGYGPRELIGAIPITRLIDVTDKKREATERDK
jgi:hypothetical protein